MIARYVIHFLLAAFALHFIAFNVRGDEYSGNETTSSLGDWPMFGFDVRRTGHNPRGLINGRYSPTPPQQFDMVAEKKFYSINCSPILGENNTIYIAWTNGVGSTATAYFTALMLQVISRTSYLSKLIQITGRPVYKTLGK